MDQETRGHPSHGPTAPGDEALPSADYLLRSLQTNHLSLSAIADQKASILVGATIVVLGVVAPIDADNGSAALRILAVTAALAGGTAVMALIPRVRSATARPNLLFFGVYGALPSEEFHRSMDELLTDTGAIHDAIIDDVHQLGQVLGRKYRRINAAHAVLMVGLAATTISYVLGL